MPRRDKWVPFRNAASEALASVEKFLFDVLGPVATVLSGLPAKSAEPADGVQVHCVVAVPMLVKLPLAVSATVTTDELPTVAIDIVAATGTVLPLVT
jgi:hypothetical protein